MMGSTEEGGISSCSGTEEGFMEEVAAKMRFKGG